MILTAEDTSVTTSDLQNLIQQPWFYAVLIAALILLVYLFSRNRKKNKLQGQIDAYQVKLNTIRSVPLAFKVTKALALSRVNKEVNDIFADSQADFDDIQNSLKQLQEMISDSDEYMQIRKYKQAEENNANIAKLLEDTNKKVTDLDNLLTGILEKEDQQREKITELKDVYHDLKLKINDKSDRFLNCWQALDRKVNNIDHQFSEFETIMASNDFDKATDKIEEIRTCVDELNDLYESIPDLISVSKKDVPAMIEEVENNYAMTKKQGAYLEHLDVNNNLALINDALQDDVRKINQCEISGVKEHLLDCEKRLSQLNQQIDKERTAYEDLMSLKDTTANNMTKLNNLVDMLNVNYIELSKRYGLVDKQNEDLAAQTAKAQSLNEQCHNLMNNIHTNNFPASTTVLTVSQLNNEIVVCLNNVNRMSEAVRTANEDEKSAREQVVKLSIILNQVRSKLRNNRIPNLTNQYDADIEQAEKYINELESLLAETPIRVNLVNSLKNNASELVAKLHKDVDKLLSTAMAAENAIVIGNMYRSTNTEIDSQLTSSELAYRKGEYVKALNIAMETIKKLHPETAQKLLDEITEKGLNTI